MNLHYESFFSHLNLYGSMSFSDNFLKIEIRSVVNFWHSNSAHVQNLHEKSHPMESWKKNERANYCNFFVDAGLIWFLDNQALPITDLVKWRDTYNEDQSLEKIESSTKIWNYFLHKNKKIV